MNGPRLLYTVAEAALILDISVDEVLARIQDGTIKYIKLPVYKWPRNIRVFGEALPVADDFQPPKSTCVKCGEVLPADDIVCWACKQKEYAESRGVNSYGALYAQQVGKCAICARKFKTLSIDHDHATGHVRGLLCTQCNTGLGQFRDNPKLLLAAIEYLKSQSITSKRITYSAMANTRMLDPRERRRINKQRKQRKPQDEQQQ